MNGAKLFVKNGINYYLSLFGKNQFTIENYIFNGRGVGVGWGWGLTLPWINWMKNTYFGANTESFSFWC